MRMEKELDKFLETVSEHVDVVAVRAGALATIANYKSKDRVVTDLERRWYGSLDAGAPDHGIYVTQEYVAELWACWAIYSRKYLRSIARPGSLPPGSVVEDIGTPTTIVDLGCGIGMTCAALKGLFPAAKVIGTNIGGDSPQTKCSKILGVNHGFEVLDRLPDVKADLVFASEYFEHLEDSIGHLKEVLAATSPTRLLVANAFGGTAPGHFRTYAGKTPKSMSIAFAKEMRTQGYDKIATKLWNSRPTYWKRVDGK